MAVLGKTQKVATISSVFRRSGENIELLVYRCYTGGLSVALVPRRLYTTLHKDEDSGSVKEDGCEVVDT